jgi:gamma-glutamyltranspeptidase/glutathione hydrolase
MNIQEAGDAPRMRHGGSSQPTDQVMTDGGTVYLESGIPNSVRDELRAMGHNISDGRASMGGYQAIMRDDVRGVYFGASESRKDGQAAGY